MIRTRPEQPDDISAIRELHTKTFGRPDEARIVHAVRQRNEPTFSLVAVEDTAAGGEAKNDAISARPDRVVAHVLFSPVVIESPGRTVKAIGLGPMAVHADFQRAGVGSRLVAQGVQTCRDAGYEIAVVLGHPTYYPRFGFTLARTRGIHWEHEMPGDPFMVMELRPGALEGVTGTARYLPEFMST